MQEAEEEDEESEAEAVEEPIAIRTLVAEGIRTTQHPADDEFMSRQSTMEERVIDRYVIETHPEEPEGPQQPMDDDHHADHQADEADEADLHQQQQFRQDVAEELDDFRTELISSRNIEQDTCASASGIPESKTPPPSPLCADEPQRKKNPPQIKSAIPTKSLKFILPADAPEEPEAAPTRPAVIGHPAASGKSN